MDCFRKEKANVRQMLLEQGCVAVEISSITLYIEDRPTVVNSRLAAGRVKQE